MTKSEPLSGAASDVSVLGLGAMGSAIANTFINQGHRTTVWNRSLHKTSPLRGGGAMVAANAAEAVAASPLTVVCLTDNAAVDEVLGSLDGSILGKLLVNVTTSSPSQARANETWAHKCGAEYIDGKILADPPYVGTPQAMFLFSGSSGAFAACQPILQELGSVKYHGEDAGAAAVEFMAQVAIGYELLIGFLHALRLVQAEGVDVEPFAERVASTVTNYPPLLASMAKAVKSGNYGPDLGSLDVQAALMDDLINHRESLGVEAIRMREVKKLMDQRIADGHGNQGFSSLFELLGTTVETA